VIDDASVFPAVILVGGDIAGGASTLTQFLFRPTWQVYATSAPDI